MKRKILELLIILIFLALQCTLGRYIAIGGIAPNLLILMPVFFGYLNGSNEGIYTGFFAGLVYDFFAYDIIGFSALAFLYIGYIAGCLYQQYEEKEILVPLCTVFLASLSFGVFSYIVNFLMQNKLDMGFYVGNIIMPETIYTVCVSLVLYPLIRPLNKLLNKRERKRVDILDERSI